MNEETFFRNHVKPFLDEHGRFDRLENILGTVPDISYSLRGAANVHGWLELKIKHASGHLYFEKFQLPWFQRRLRATNRGLWIIATDGFKLFLFHPQQLLPLPKTTKGKWTLVDVSKVESHIPPELPWPWDMVWQKLANE